MSDPESFLSRWSRRKREALRETDMSVGLRGSGAASSSPPRTEVGSTRLRSLSSLAETRVDAVSAGEGSGVAVVDWGTSAPQPPDPPPQPSPTRGEGAAAVRPMPAPIDLPFDAASLPPIESITAETDIRGFLASGVPSELTRAALRRAWACDPKIRNFVGLAEYDWDFNAPDSMAGFGPLQITDEVGKMAAQIVEPGRSAPEAGNLLDPAPTIPKAEQIADESDTAAARGATAEMHDQAKQRDEPVNAIGMSSHPDELTHRGHERVAVQHTAVNPDKGNAFVKRRHGGALPK